MVLKRLLKIAEAPPLERRLPAGERIYAIGDIHGRLDLFENLLAAIDADGAGRGPAETTILLLGDLVDRGPESRGVVERAMRLARERRTVMLMGNHEELLLKVWEGDRRAAGIFHQAGGFETAISYGITEAEYESGSLGDVTGLIHDAVPRAHVEFIRGFEDWHERGDYLFVHAGIRPGVALAKQRKSDLRWIRGDFLDDTGEHGALVIHGHTITGEPDEKSNRIGIDTGAFHTGVLTAIGLEGCDRWFLTGER